MTYNIKKLSDETSKKRRVHLIDHCSKPIRFDPVNILSMIKFKDILLNASSVIIVQKIDMQVHMYHQDWSRVPDFTLLPPRITISPTLSPADNSVEINIPLTYINIQVVEVIKIVFEKKRGLGTHRPQIFVFCSRRHVYARKVQISCLLNC